MEYIKFFVMRVFLEAICLSFYIGTCIVVFVLTAYVIRDDMLVNELARTLAEQRALLEQLDLEELRKIHLELELELKNPPKHKVPRIPLDPESHLLIRYICFSLVVTVAFLFTVSATIS